MSISSLHLIKDQATELSSNEKANSRTKEVICPRGSQRAMSVSGDRFIDRQVARE